ncbi:LrgB family protein [Falsibacillus albus]|uniref:LrgB family protein n=1 Tax=Falsibacillus albus TaxID=2478915 RepID=A0A3L7JYS2_9BACI|nr:LrgB family protein [Falsibacillus albus]RLQ95414.1 LrgB family protein [Falsibacillus albus]
MIWFVLAITLYYLTKSIYIKYKNPLLNPLILCPSILAFVIMMSWVPAKEFSTGTKSISYLLGPATVSFAVPVYRHLDLIKKYAIELMLSVAAGSITAVMTSFLLSKWIHFSSQMESTMIPRSITTPIAMDVSKTLGGIPTLTAAFVICTGIIGSIVGPIVIRMCAIKTPIAKGVLLGMGAHGAGTSKAFEIGTVEGSISSIAMILGALATIVWAYIWIPLLLS